METGVRALSICYRLLSRMDRDVQLASLQWLSDRLRDDEKKAKRGLRGMPSEDQLTIRRSVGDATLSLLSLLSTTGGSVGRRTVEFRGPVNADVLVQVRPTAVT